MGPIPNPLNLIRIMPAEGLRGRGGPPFLPCKEENQLRYAFALAFMAVFVAIVAGLGPVLLIGLSKPLAVPDSYVMKVLWFTLLQAGLSTIIALAVGLPVARALVRRRFPGRTVMIRLLSLPLAIPAIVAVLGIVSVFGSNGWLSGVVDIYGLGGILLAHLFFNFPLAARLALASLDAVPPEYHRLAAQLGFGDHDVWRLIDRPALVAMLPGTSLLIFLLCAASFTIVLTLGGGPAATTLEVAIYQALRFDFDPARATVLAVVQLGLCAMLFVLARRLSVETLTWPKLRRQGQRFDGQSPSARLTDLVALAVALLILVPPVGAIIVSGLSGEIATGQLLRATLSSLAIGFAAAGLALLASWGLAQLAARSRMARQIAGVTTLAAFILPPAVMATGWFILMNRYASMTALSLVLVVVMNAMMALPFAYQALAPAVARTAASNDRLCASLGISGLSRFRLIDGPLLKSAFALTLLMGFIVSLGDLTALLLFGTGELVTLPLLIYQQMGSYRMQGSAFTALVLAGLSFAAIVLADRWSRTDA